MKRTLALALALAAALPLAAQTDGDKLVARVNGEEFTNRRVDALWNRLSDDMQNRYLKAGGKLKFLENQIDRYVIIQEAINSGYAASLGAPVELDAAAEGVLFTSYVKDVIAPPLIPEAAMLKVYEENKADFTAPEQAWMRIIRAEKKDNPERAREIISKAMVEIFSARTALAQTYSAEHLNDALAKKFSEVAARVSDHPSAKEGGDMGFVALYSVAPKLADAARTMKAGTISGILETPDAFQMVLLHEHKPQGVENFEAAKPAIRAYLMNQDPKKIMAAVAKKSAELRAAGKVEIFAQNLR
jgi:PPIC-type peptidyl-prolyl cis-trans isomerase-like protein